MGNDTEVLFQGLKDKSKKIFSPEFFGQYSFEYAYRLLLVYLSTRRSAVNEIRVSSPDAFDHAFEEDIWGAICFVAKFHGVNAEEKELRELCSLANESLILYVQSSMSKAPGKVAKTVAKSMDKLVMEDLPPAAKASLTCVFADEA